MSWDGSLRNLLCVRLDSLGDVLMTTPALRALKSLRPSPRITLLGSPAGVAIAEMIPEIDAAIAYGAPWMKATAQPDPAADRALIEQLAKEDFDAAIVFTVFSQSPLPAATVCHLAGIPRRVAHCRENPYHLLTDWLRETEPETRVRHEVQRQLDLVAALGAHTRDPRLALRIPACARRSARERLARAGVRVCGRWIAIHPGASAPSRRYPPESFADAARELAQEGFQIVFVGTPDEVALVHEIQRAMGAPSISFAGRTTLPQLAALLELAPLVIANNSGPAHVAAAVGTPLVDLYALTNPQHTPWGVRHRVLNHDVPCRDCYRSLCPNDHACLRSVAPAEVVAAAHDLLNGTGPRLDLPSPLIPRAPL
jgi:lipopolysaccharide heptosyltransferase II